MKLTKPQLSLLAGVVNGDGSVSDSYKPAQKLVELGLAEWRTKHRAFLLPTEEGRSALRNPSDSKGDAK